MADSYCTKIEACPSFEQVEVYHYHPQKWNEQNDFAGADFHSENIPLPEVCKSFSQIAEGDTWRAVVTGVGGSGVTTISRVLANAALEMGGRQDLDFKFVDQKGLAQRNGNVTGHLAIYSKGKSAAAGTPKARADLLLSSDFLDGLSKVAFVSPEGLALADLSFQLPMSALLERDSHLQRETLLTEWRQCLGERGQVLPFKESSKKYLGRPVYATSMLLGAAFQSGRLPFSFSDMLRALEKTFPERERESNLRAFEWGRRLWFERGETSLSTAQEGETLKQFEQSLRASLLPWHNKKLVLKLFHRDLKRLRSYFPAFDPNHLAHYVHDIYIYDRGKQSEAFLTEAREISQLYPESELAAIALRTLAKTFFIKDEIFVAHQLISPLKRQRDRKTYAVLGSDYRTLPINRPRFEFLGLKLEFGVRPRYWMLAFMRHARLLRPLLGGRLGKWHQREKKIALEIRRRLSQRPEESASETDKRRHLVKLDNVKGYREVRYRAFDTALES